MPLGKVPLEWSKISSKSFVSFGASFENNPKIRIEKFNSAALFSVKIHSNQSFFLYLKGFCVSFYPLKTAK
jgi:hypothetical protein